MFDTNPKVQEICRLLNEAQYDFDFNEVEIAEARKYGGDLQRLYDRKDRLLSKIYKLQHQRDTFHL